MNKNNFFAYAYPIAIGVSFIAGIILGGSCMAPTDDDILTVHDTIVVHDTIQSKSVKSDVTASEPITNYYRYVDQTMDAQGRIVISRVEHNFVLYPGEYSISDKGILCFKGLKFQLSPETYDYLIRELKGQTNEPFGLSLAYNDVMDAYVVCNLN